ncbi:WD40-repeat-containing domain protein [Chlamydoabsidia padenii]|nr:WD40-repeat-containing domain protein [Chlamydoabsidia padenii]
MVNTPQALPASLPQQHPGNRLGAPSPSFSPQQMQRPGPGNPAGNENMAGHPEGMMNSPMVGAQGIPMNPQGQMMMNQRPNAGPPAAIIASSMNILGFGGRDPQSLTPEERAAVQMQIRRQTMYINQPGMMRNPNMMVNSQAQSRLQMQQQQIMMNQQLYQQQQHMQQGQPQQQLQQGQAQAPQQSGQPQTQQHQPAQPSIPSQQGIGPQQNPQGQQPHPQGAAQQPQSQPQQGVPQPGQQGQPGQHPSANNQTGNGIRPPGAMVPGSGAPNTSGPGQMAGNMQNPNLMSGQFGGGEAMNMMLAQQMMKNGQMAGLTPQQQQQQQFLTQQQHQRMLFSQRRMMQQQQLTNQGGQTPPNPNMGSPNPPAPMNAGSPQDDKNRSPLALYQRRQMNYVMQQQQHQDQQRQQYGQQQHGQTPPQQQPQQVHPTKRQRPNPDIDKPNGSQGANQSPQMGMASPHVMNSAQTPQNTNNIPGSSQASPVLSMQQRLSQQQHQQSPFNQDPNVKPSQSPQMNRNMNKQQHPNQTPQQLPQQLPIQGTPNLSQQGMPPSATPRMGWNPSTQQGGDMQSPGMVEGDQSPATQAAVATPGGNGGMMNNGPVNSNNNNMMSFDLERFMMSDGGDFGEIFTAGDDGGEHNLLMGGDNNEMFGGGFLASMGGGFGGDSSSSLGGMDNATSLQLYSELTGHSTKVSTVAFSLDGQWLASAGHDRKVLIWAVHDKLLRWTLEGHTSQITCARWSPDQRNLLVTSSYDKTLRVWDIGQAMKGGGGQGDVKQIAKFDCKAEITAVDFAPDRPDTVCSLDAEGELNVWHIPSSKCEKTIKIAASKSLFAANPLRFHPRLGKILACAAGNQLFVIDIDVVKNNTSSADTAAVRTINADHSKNICSLDWSTDGSYLVASSENAVMVYETGQWKLINRHTATDKISACAFVMPTTNSNNNGASSGGSNAGTAAGGVTGAEKLRVVYGTYEAIYVWQCSVPGVQPKQAGKQSGMVTGLACINTNGQTIMASASHYKEKNLMLWTL